MSIDALVVYRLKQILKHGLFSLVIFFLMIQFIIGNEFKIETALFSFLYGCGGGFIFQFTNTIKFHSMPFLVRNILRISLLLFFVLALLILFHFVFSGFLSKFENQGILFVISPEFISLSINILIVTFFIVLLIELERHLGRNFIIDFILSKYMKPHDEDRVIMFLDLKDSTTIAEEIGNEQFVAFINFCYELLSKAIIINKAAILKYVGDEVILTWPSQKGINKSRCINLYFDYFNELELHRSEFETEFGFFPVFKAGVHSGKVTAAFLGTLKKQMDYSGDVMNTTARIQSVCNQYRADLLISSELVSKLPTDEKYNYIDLGNLDLKGKVNKVGVCKVELT